ncbi:MAG: CHAT domain-containing protein [Desulfococcaceae bacterium]
MMGEYIKGLEYTERSYEKILQSKKWMGENGLVRRIAIEGALESIGTSYHMLGNFENAEDYYKKSLAVFDELRAESDGRYSLLNISTMLNLGILYEANELYDKAIDCFLNSISIAKEYKYTLKEAIALSGLSYAYLKIGRYDESVKCKQQASSIFQGLRETARIAETYLGIAFIHLEYHKPDQAYPYLEKHMAMVRENNIVDHKLNWELQQGLSMFYVQKNELQKALDHFEKSLQSIESARSSLRDSEFKIGYMQDKQEVYDDYIEALHTLHRQHPKDGYDRRAFEIFERKQGRTFLEEMGKSGARQYAGLPEAVRQEEAGLEKQIGLLSGQLSIQREKAPEKRDLKAVQRIEAEMKQVQSDLKKLEKIIQTAYPDYYAIKYPKPVSSETVQKKLLKPGETMLIYNVMKNQTCVWTIDRKNFSLTAIDAGRDELAEKMEIFRNHALGAGGKNLRGEIIRMKKDEKVEIPDLYTLLFPNEVQKHIKQSKNLYIIPTGPLYLLPFEALKTEDDSYLIKSHGISYLSSASLLNIIRESKSRRKERALYPLLAFANPVYGETADTAEEKNRPDSSERLSELQAESLRSTMNGNFMPLPETEDEAEAIRQLLDAPLRSDPLQLQVKAARSNVLAFNTSERLDDYRYLVFACHGVIPETTSIIQQPALVLSNPDPETKQDGFLTMADVFGLKMNADLVTLSACNTGRGKSVSGEGVMGLTRSFMYAGTPAVTVTLWSVESLSAKELNVGLFEKLKAGKNRAQALREIKLDMINGSFGEEWQHPYYWAPLVMFGDGN